ncbi:transporter [Nonlabens ulvanivorans]|uniref:Transporter n=1 Tax=Nonlabens ulvanivorans TaxID=906888 RepID=A0A090WHW0_NONUL|nr:transporter [Nonlabens ulvanivorans]GAL76541.1 transporter [Nonlabens ulvanivorans]
MAFSLFLTALGGIYMSTYPSYLGLSILYGYWGFTTIFLFWAAMIKATRVWGWTTSTRYRLWTTGWWSWFSFVCLWMVRYSYFFNTISK